MLAGGDKDAQKLALQAANKGWDKPPTPVATTPTSPAPKPMGMMPPRPMAPPPSQNGFGFDFNTSPLAEATTMPVYEAGDPTFRNSRND
jgi:hypothetical protein